MAVKAAAAVVAPVPPFAMANVVPCVVAMLAAALPSKFTVPVTAPVNVIARAVVSFAALPVVL
jgi:hypothetical protein